MPIVNAKKSHFVNLFTNFIENGWKYNDDQIKKVNISCEKSAPNFIIKIVDNGIGIEPKYSNKIFEPFVRLHSNTEYNGTGLGLFICQKIVNLYDGRIDLCPVYKEGSCFSIILPQEFIVRYPVEEKKTAEAL